MIVLIFIVLVEHQFKEIIQVHVHGKTGARACASILVTRSSSILYFSFNNKYFDKIVYTNMY